MLLASGYNSRVKATIVELETSDDKQYGKVEVSLVRPSDNTIDVNYEEMGLRRASAARVYLPLDSTVKALMDTLYASVQCISDAEDVFGGKLSVEAQLDRVHPFYKMHFDSGVVVDVFPDSTIVDTNEIEITVLVKWSSPMMEFWKMLEFMLDNQ